ncbi:MAG: YjbE family putative metal transport protein [Alphaproteobacteria bacterium]|nr:YjbE family putative metal transport protein [Alphaproteobacteria bacterium]
MDADNLLLGLSIAQWTMLGTVIMVNFVLSGDNAVVVGMAASGLPKEQRQKALWFGIVAATVLRVAFALLASQLLQVVGLLLAGGVLLLWVAWKLYREISPADDVQEAEGAALLGGELVEHVGPQKTMGEALWQILVADVSMSLDNVLAVAGAARSDPFVLAVGLIVSVLLMGIAAAAIAKLIEKHRWIAYVGLVLILYIAAKMVWDGGQEVFAAVAGA